MADDAWMAELDDYIMLSVESDSWVNGGFYYIFDVALRKLLSFIFFMLLAMSTCIKDSRVTISEAFFALEICLGLWWVWGIMERWMLEVGQGDVRMRHHFWR
ncbi:hypothetical protein BDP67DRAFT_492598 [Colletotrichum lupini]|nr:hypothetical protein BDP67DRAFT_492598 [Colletotrichum lupini]